MIVDYVGEVVGRETIGLQEHLVVEEIIPPDDHAVDMVFERSHAGLGDALADDVWLASRNAGVGILGGEESARVVGLGRPGRGRHAICGERRLRARGVVVAILEGLNRGLGFGFAAEAAIGSAQLHELLGILFVERFALALHVRAVVAAPVGSFVVVQAGQPEAIVDNLHGVIDIATPIGVFDAQHERSAIVARDEIGV